MHAAVQRVIDHLESLLDGQQIGTLLPKNHDLAAKLGVSAATVQIAYQNLIQSGRITRVRRKGTFVGSPDAVRNHWQKPVQIKQPLQEILADRIRQGDYKSGMPMPPLKAIVSEFHVSKSSAIAAYQGLLKKGLMTRLGKSYLAGEKQMRTSLFSSASVIALVLQPVDEFRILYSPLDGPFYLSFYRTLQSAAVLVRKLHLPCDPARWKGGVAPDLDLSLIRNAIKESPTRVLGLTLFPYTTGFTFPQQWLLALGELRLPLIGYYPNEEILPASMPRQACLFSSFEEDLCGSVISAAQELGHRDFIYIALNDAPWTDKRAEALHTAIEKRIPGGSLKLLTPEGILTGSLRDLMKWRPGERLFEAGWEGVYSTPELVDRLVPMRAFFRKVSSKLPRSLAQIAARSPESSDETVHQYYRLFCAFYVAHLIRYPKVTAILFANDETAHLFEALFAALHVKIPENYSLFAFDNFPVHLGNLSATVDRGQERSAVEVANALIAGDLSRYKQGQTHRTRPLFIPRPGLAIPRVGEPKLPQGLDVLLQG